MNSSKIRNIIRINKIKKKKKYNIIFEGEKSELSRMNK
jgi:hypothetical protein